MEYGVAHALRHAIPRGMSRAVVFTLAAVIAIAWPLAPALHARGLSLPAWHGFLLGAFASWTLAGRMSARWFGLYAASLVAVWFVTRESFTLVCLATAMLIVVAGRAGTLSRWCDGAVPQLLGRMSYSLYLLHVPVSGAAFYLLSRFQNGAPSRALLIALVVLAINFVAAWAFWWAAERPSTALARRLRKR